MKVNKKRQDDLILKQWFKIMVIVISIFTLLVSISTIYQSFNITRTQNEIKYIYDVDDNVDYKVYLYENSFFDEEYIGMDKQYVSKLVYLIKTNFYSSLSISKLTNIEYDYTLNATINGIYQNDADSFSNTLWTKHYTLVEKTTENLLNTSNAEINVPIEIYFPFFQNLVAEFQRTMHLDIKAILDVDLIVNYKFYIDGDKIVKSDTINMKIPLTDPTFSITTNYPETNDEVVFYELESEHNNVKFIGGLLLFISSLLGFVSFVMMLIRDTKKTTYIIKLNRILKDYGDIIAETANLPNLDNQDILDIKEFIDLVNIEEELKIPIIYYEQRKNKEGWFLLTHNSHTYRFILKEKNCNKK